MTSTRRKPRRKSKARPSGAIWEIPDVLWVRILPILLEGEPQTTIRGNCKEGPERRKYKRACVVS